MEASVCVSCSHTEASVSVSCSHTEASVSPWRRARGYDAELGQEWTGM